MINCLFVTNLPKYMQCFFVIVNSKDNLNCRDRSRTVATFNMEHFVIIVITKCYILDVAAVLDPPLKFLMHSEAKFCGSKC